MAGHNNLEDALLTMKEAECIHEPAVVNSAFDQMANEIEKILKDSNPIVITILQGGLIPSAKILERLNFPMEIDSVHATRYQGGLRGGKLNWKSEATLDPKGRDILLVDDILDEGVTVMAIDEYFIQKGAKRVYKAILVEKTRPRATDVTIDFVGLMVPDRYVFGCGMDYKGYWRNLNGIYAVDKTR
ncbi:MAG TPA: hypoxanthine-guanine phosphoribosyltransferase [Gammaproteobacteria bacterium]|nr:hypoxanthine-guanine phosphoribosyltransferase [Gammaproteobacteria bacterium]